MISLQGYRSGRGLKLAAGWAGTSESRAGVGRNRWHALLLDRIVSEC
jgi:hypothetical protein